MVQERHYIASSFDLHRSQLSHSSRLLNSSDPIRRAQWIELHDFEPFYLWQMGIKTDHDQFNLDVHLLLWADSFVDVRRSRRAVSLDSPDRSFDLYHGNSHVGEQLLRLQRRSQLCPFYRSAGLDRL